MIKSTSVLLVEDDTDDQRFFIEAIGDIKNVILYGIANNGREALDWLENSDILPDIIFIDIHMPLMNGIDCLSGIKQNTSLGHIPVIMLANDIEKKAVALRIGAKAVIQKTFDMTHLSSQLVQMIDLYSLCNSHTNNSYFRTFYNYIHNIAVSTIYS